MTKSIQGWRWIVKLLHALVLLGTPFLKIDGQSVLRFDMPSLRLYFFGIVLWMDEFFIVLAATLFLTFLIVFITVVFGRVWCGWLCPQTVISDITGFIEKTSKKGIIYKVSGMVAVFLISMIIGASLIWYFVSPYDFFQRLTSWQLGEVIWGFWIVLTIILFLNFTLVRRRFCATVCPYARAQSLLFDDKTLIIAFDRKRKDECLDCRACVKVCPVGIDIRKGPDIACISCAECIDSCGEIFRAKGKKGLINYFFGETDKKSMIRQSAVITGLLSLLSLFLFIHLLKIRKDLDITVIPDYQFRPKITGTGELINAFVISVENRHDRDKRIIMRSDGNVKIIPDSITVRAGEVQRTKVFVISSGITNTFNLTFISDSQNITEEITIIKP